MYIHISTQDTCNVEICDDNTNRQKHRGGAGAQLPTHININIKSINIINTIINKQIDK